MSEYSQFYKVPNGLYESDPCAFCTRSVCSGDCFYSLFDDIDFFKQLDLVREDDDK